MKISGVFGAIKVGGATHLGPWQKLVKCKDGEKEEWLWDKCNPCLQIYLQKFIIY